MNQPSRQFKSFIFLITISIIFQISIAFGKEYSDNFIDHPAFSILPNSMVADVFKKLGQTKIYKTNLAHNYLLYYDPEYRIGLIIYLYGDNTVWSIEARKETSQNPSQALHKLASLTLAPAEKYDDKLFLVRIGPMISKKGIKFGMTKGQIEDILNTKISMIKNYAILNWTTEKDGKIDDYGGIRFTFKKGKLVSIQWYGVDP